MIRNTENQHKTDSLEEKYANVVGQLSGVTERLDHAERDLDLERATREDIIRQEVERRVAEELAKRQQEFDKREADLQKEMDKREEEMQKTNALMQERLIADAKRQIEEARKKAEEQSVCKMASQFQLFLQAYLKAIDGKHVEAHAFLGQFKEASKETEKALKEDIEKALEKAARKSKGKVDQIAELVRMLFTQKRERIVFNEEEKATLIEDILKSAGMTEEAKTDFKQCNAKIREYRLRKQAERILRGEKQRGHGRNVIPQNLPRLTEIVIWPEEYIGHESEYRIVFPGDVQEFIMPSPHPYMVQPVRRPIVARKDDIENHLIQSPCYEGPLWKSYASAELLSQLEVNKYANHLPFYRQVKMMERQGLKLAETTINDWHEAVCDMLEPLYKLQWQRVMKSRLLAADGSPMPVVDNEKHKTVKQYIIEYRSIDTGIPIFLSTPGTGNGRGKKVIEANLSEWTGQALMCDAYAGYDWIKKTGRRLCRCAAHARREAERALKENPKLAKQMLLMYQQIYASEEMIKAEGLTGDAKIQFRNEIAAPLWNTLYLWCMKEILSVPKDSLIHKAMNYLIRHYGELTEYLNIAGMPLDNNDTERSIRDMVMGKKAYLFCQTDDACNRAALMYSLLGACKVLGKNPERWLTHALNHIGSTPKESLHILLPEEWEDNQ